MNPLKTYYRLTKPGIVYGNIVTTIAGFFFASKFHGSISVFFGVIAGTALIIASACVFNNYLDRELDKKMDRTKKRALVTGAVSALNAILFATILGILGFTTLTRYTNPITVLVGLIGFVDYVILYGISKRASIHGTLIGSISGATPILAGYTAVTNRVDVGGIILFLILVLWQMPHFYAIAIYRRNDYKAAKIPVLPVKKSIKMTKIHILLYLIAFIIATMMLSVLKLTGYTYAIIMAILGGYWLWIDIQGFFTKDDTRWARKLFFVSLIVMISLSIAIPIGTLLP